MSNDISMAPEAEPEAQTFGEAVRRLRTERGLTQEKLAQASDLTTNYVSDIERGRTMVSLKTILKLASRETQSAMHACSMNSWWHRNIAAFRSEPSPRMRR